MYAIGAARSLLGGPVSAAAVPPPGEAYVQGVTASSAVICWMGVGPSLGVAEYRPEAPTLLPPQR